MAPCKFFNFAHEREKRIVERFRLTGRGKGIIPSPKPPAPSISTGLVPTKSAERPLMASGHPPFMTQDDYLLDFSLLSRPTDGNSLEWPLDYRRDEEDGFKG